jgi:transcriptional regulator with XRE-family HTH domain
MDVRVVIKQRLQELGLEQRDLAAAAQVTESYISQLLTRKKAPPAVDRTDLYERMNAFLKLPKGQLSAMVEAQRREELKRQLADPPAPLFKEVRELVIRKSKTEKRGEIRTIFEKQAFGELERLVTQKLLDVIKGIVKDELKNERWLRIVADLLDRSYEEMRANILEFLDTDVFNVSPNHCSLFLAPLIGSWDIDLKTFEMEILLNRRLASTQLVRFRFAQVESDESLEEEPSFQEFLRNATMSGDATQKELEFLRGLRFTNKRPSPLYYYRELQSLRDPLHFPEGCVGPMQKRRDAGELDKQLQLDSRKRALRRWVKNRIRSEKRDGEKTTTPSRRPGRTDIN